MSHNYRRQAWQKCRKEIGEQIRNMRLEQGLSPETAAEMLHIGTKHLLCLEAGDIRRMEISYLHALAYKYHYKLKISFEKKLEKPNESSLVFF